jgi:3-isopropylmalate/(R)-2-methylmalate dehydratase small subunit
MIIRSRTVVLPWDDIDTDQIIPARFLKTTRREGLGAHAFADRRGGQRGGAHDAFPLDRVDLTQHRILVAGRNFGCGSSREHAAWALVDLGFRAVLSSQLADIFRANALENGLLALQVSAELHRWLLAHPGAELAIDLGAGLLHWPDGAPEALDIEPFARHRILHGVTTLDHLLRRGDDIGRFEHARAVAEGKEHG